MQQRSAGTISQLAAEPDAAESLEAGNARKALAFLRAIHGSKPDDLYAYLWYMERGRPGLSFFSRDLDALAAKAAEWSALGRDVYFGLGLSKTDNGPERRIKTAECCAVSCLWADIDIRGAAHAARNLPESEAVLKPLLEALPVPPSLVVHSGHGLHCYWLFRETWVFEGGAENRLAESYQIALHSALAALAGVRGWTVDKRTDLASVLRVAGTQNRKRVPHTPVQLLDWGSGARYNPGDLEQFLDVDAAARQLAKADDAEDYPVDPNAKPLWLPQYWVDRYLDQVKRGLLSRHAAAIGLANQLRDDRQPKAVALECLKSLVRQVPQPPERDHEFPLREALAVADWSYRHPPRQQLCADASACEDEAATDPQGDPRLDPNETGSGNFGVSIPPACVVPQIDATNQNLPVVTAEAWKALIRSNVPPRLFRYAGVASRIELDDDGAPLVKTLGRDRMRNESARSVRWYRWVKSQKEAPLKMKPAYPPLTVVNDMLACPEIPLPILTAVIQAPTFLANRTLHDKPGYNPDGRTYYVPADGLSSRDIPEQPTAGDITTAKRLLTDELLGEFPFVGEAERAHTLAALLLPFCRPMIDGPTPLHLIEKPTPGTGAGLLAEAITYPALGRLPSTMNEGRDEDEWRKRITATLRKSPGAILIDNLKRPLLSANLSSVLTLTRWEDRILGLTETCALPNRALWLATGNNPRIDLEMARRIVRIRLDAKVEQPWMRKGFRHADLRGWMREKRSALVWAALVLIRYWIVTGMPATTTPKLGSYEAWSDTLGGILQAAGVDGFLGNLQEFYTASDGETEQVKAFLAAWHAKYAGREVLTAELFELAVAAGFDLGGRTDQSQRIRLGGRIKQWRDRQYAIHVDEETRVDVRIEHAGTYNRAVQWRLRIVE